jgi:predicted nucleotidyltransferase
MRPVIAPELQDMPEISALAVTNFLDSARQAFGDDLRSLVLYGSAAEGRLRPTSDINLLLVLSVFDPLKANATRSQLALACSAARLRAMFLLESEVHSAVELFALKFADIRRRHRVLYGPDPFAAVSAPRSVTILRVRQVLLNLSLRLREAYIERGSAPERLSALIADAAAPLRSCAATMLELEGKPAAPPKEALLNLVASLGEPGWDEILANISAVRQREILSPDRADATLFRLIDLAGRLRSRVELLR